MEKFKQDLQNYQINSKTYVKYDTDGLNQYQNYLYKRALYGLSSLTEQELATMCSKKKQRIINVYKKAQIVLNKLKQDISFYNSCTQQSRELYQIYYTEQKWLDNWKTIYEQIKN